MINLEKCPMGHEMGQVLFVVPGTQGARKIIPDYYYCKDCLGFFKLKIEKELIKIT